MSRKDKLETLLTIAWDSLGECPPDKRSPLIAQIRGILTELDGDAAPAQVERNGLVDFQEALAQRRQSAAAGKGRTRRAAD